MSKRDDSPAGIEARLALAKYEHALQTYADKVYPAAEAFVVAQRSWNPLKRRTATQAASELQSELRNLSEILLVAGLDMSRPGSIQEWCREFATYRIQPNIDVNDARTREDASWVNRVHTAVLIFLDYAEGHR